MRNVNMAEVESAHDELVELTSGVFGAGRHVQAARRMAADTADLADLAAALGVPRTGREVQRIRRSIAAIARHVELMATSAAAAADRLPQMAHVHSVPAVPVARRATARPLRDAVEETRRRLWTAQHHATVAARLAAGFAAIHEPDDGPEPLWDAACHVLQCLPLDDGREIVLELTGGVADRRAIAGLVTHVARHRPAHLTLTTEDGRNRYVQVLIHPEGALAESVSDDFLLPADRLSSAEHRTLGRLGFAPPDDDHVNWHHLDADRSVTSMADLLLGVLTGVHGARRGDPVRATVALAAGHPELPPVDPDDPAVLTLDSPSAPALARAMADRLGPTIDLLGVDAVWATVAQPGSPYVAHLGSNMDGRLFTEVTGNFYLEPEDQLSDEQHAHLRTLGWEDPIDDQSGDADLQPRNHTRVWPAPFDLEVVCWHVAMTLVAVHGLDPSQPVITTIEPFG